METDPPKPFEDKGSERKKIVEFGNARGFRSGEKQKNKLEEILHFAKDHPKDTASYILLVIGLILMFFDGTSIYGSLCVGIIFSIYFLKELSLWVSQATSWSGRESVMKPLVLGGLLFGLFFRAPFVLIGIALVVAIKMMMFPDQIGTEKSDT